MMRLPSSFTVPRGRRYFTINETRFVYIHQAVLGAGKLGPKAASFLQGYSFLKDNCVKTNIKRNKMQGYPMIEIGL